MRLEPGLHMRAQARRELGRVLRQYMLEETHELVTRGWLSAFRSSAQMAIRTTKIAARVESREHQDAVLGSYWSVRRP